MYGSRELLGSSSAYHSVNNTCISPDPGTLCMVQPEKFDVSARPAPAPLTSAFKVATKRRCPKPLTQRRSPAGSLHHHFLGGCKCVASQTVDSAVEKGVPGLEPPFHLPQSSSSSAASWASSLRLWRSRQSSARSLLVRSGGLAPLCAGSQLRLHRPSWWLRWARF